jgi:hypothetical protein
MSVMYEHEWRAVEQSRAREVRWLAEARRLALEDEGDVRAIRVEIARHERALAALPIRR